MWSEIDLGKMDLETKRDLLKWTDSYWDMLPTEMKDLILEYKESQEFIDRRESASNRALCRQIRMYELLRQRWQIGHVQCKPIHRNLGVKCECACNCECMRVFGWYLDLRGMIHKTYLGMSLQHAMTNCDIRRVNFRDGEWMLIGAVRASIRM